MYFFLFVFPPVWQLALKISPHLFPPFLLLPCLIPCYFCHFLPYRQSYPLWEYDRSHSQLCCIAFARGHRETVENLRRYSLPFNRVCSQSNSLWKMTSRSAFRCAGRRPAVTHSRTDPAKSFFLFLFFYFILFFFYKNVYFFYWCLTWVIAWHRTPTTHRTLSVRIYVFSSQNSGVRFQEHKIPVKLQESFQ